MHSHGIPQVLGKFDLNFFLFVGNGFAKHGTPSIYTDKLRPSRLKKCCHIKGIYVHGIWHCRWICGMVDFRHLICWKHMLERASRGCGDYRADSAGETNERVRIDCRSDVPPTFRPLVVVLTNIRGRERLAKCQRQLFKNIYIHIWCVGLLMCLYI